MLFCYLPVRLTGLKNLEEPEEETEVVLEFKLPFCKPMEGVDP